MEFSMRLDKQPWIIPVIMPVRTISGTTGNQRTQCVRDNVIGLAESAFKCTCVHARSQGGEFYIQHPILL